MPAPVTGSSAQLEVKSAQLEVKARIYSNSWGFAQITQTCIMGL
jgi:hypothetical protein